MISCILYLLFQLSYFPNFHHQTSDFKYYALILCIGISTLLEYFNRYHQHTYVHVCTQYVHFERRLVKLITELFLKCIAACLMLCIWLNSGVRILQSIQQRFTWRLHNNFCQGIFKNPPLSVSFSCLLAWKILQLEFVCLCVFSLYLVFYLKVLC